MAQKTGRKAGSDQSLVADGKSMQQLIFYLCTEPKKKGKRELYADVCRKCESQCAFGREWVRKWDAGERPGQQAAKKPEDKPKKPAPVRKGKPVKKACDEMTMQEQLEKKLKENRQLMEMNRVLELEYKDMQEQLRKANELLDVQRKAMENQETLNSELRETIANAYQKQILQMKEVETAKEECQKLEEARKADKLLITKLKAMLWDMEHPEEE